MPRRPAQTTRSSSDHDGRGVAFAPDPVEFLGGLALAAIVAVGPLLILALLAYSAACALNLYE